MHEERTHHFTRDAFSGGGYHSHEGGAQSSGHGRGGGIRGRGGGEVGYRGRSRGGLGYKKHYKKSYSDEVIDEVKELLGKKFHFKDEFNQWNLPPADAMFRHESFQVPKLLKLKEELIAAKIEVGRKELTSWHKHTNFTNRAGIVIPALRRDFQPEMCTQGWAKFHEILGHFGALVPETTTKFNSVHLCEGPGGFVASLNHFLKTHRMDCEWRWKALSLNPYFEGTL